MGAGQSQIPMVPSGLRLPAKPVAANPVPVAPAPVAAKPVAPAPVAAKPVVPISRPAARIPVTVSIPQLDSCPENPDDPSSANYINIDSFDDIDEKRTAFDVFIPILADRLDCFTMNVRILKAHLETEKKKCGLDLLCKKDVTNAYKDPIFEAGEPISYTKDLYNKAVTERRDFENRLKAERATAAFQGGKRRTKKQKKQKKQKKTKRGHVRR